MSIGYRGIINIPIGSRAGYVDIDPPQQEGNCLQLVGATVGFDARSETGNINIGSILSVKATPRTTWTLPADGVPSDAIFAAMITVYASQQRNLIDLLKDGFLFGDGYISQYPYVLDKCRFLAYLQDGVAVAADVDVVYELHFEETKITNQLQQALLAKIYS
jgi:hypothetical protein